MKASTHRAVISQCTFSHCNPLGQQGDKRRRMTCHGINLSQYLQPFKSTLHNTGIRNETRTSEQWKRAIL